MNKFQKEKLKALNKLYRERAYLGHKAHHLSVNRLPKMRSSKRIKHGIMQLFNLAIKYESLTFQMLAVAAQPMPNKFPKGGSCSEVMITDLPIHCDPHRAPEQVIMINPNTKLPKRVAIIGGGMSTGKTAAILSHNNGIHIAESLAEVMRKRFKSE